LVKDQLSIPELTLETTNFVSEIAMLFFFTQGGGKGVEGYVLTSFQAAIQVILSIEDPSIPAEELDFFTKPEPEKEVKEKEEEKEEEEEFYDAMST
jgi:hypothetical protein